MMTKLIDDFIHVCVCCIVAKDVFICRSQILALNGLSNITDEEEAESLLKDLLEMAEKDFSYKVDVLAHKNPKLCRYLYKHSLGTTKGEGMMEESQAQSYAGMHGNKHFGQMAAGSSSSSKDVAIKFENEDLRALSDTKQVLESAKTALGKLLLQAQDLIPYVKDAQFQKTFDNIASNLEQFLHDLRAFLVKIAVLPDPDGAKMVLKQAEDLKGQAFIHQDGIKAKIKHARTLAATAGK